MGCAIGCGLIFVPVASASGTPIRSTVTKVAGSTDLVGFACPPSGRCIAEGETGDHATVVSPVSQRGQPQRPTSVANSNGASGVACPRANFCIAISQADSPSTSAVIIPIRHGVAGGAKSCRTRTLAASHAEAPHLAGRSAPTHEQGPATSSTSSTVGSFTSTVMPASVCLADPALRRRAASKSAKQLISLGGRNPQQRKSRPFEPREPLDHAHRSCLPEPHYLYRGRVRNQRDFRIPSWGFPGKRRARARRSSGPCSRGGRVRRGHLLKDALLCIWVKKRPEDHRARA